MLSTLPPNDPFLNNPFWALDWEGPAFGPGPSTCPFPDPLSYPVKPAGNSKARAGSDHATPPIIDERKRRRMISNRESARRSRMRKQKHLENLRFQVNRFRIQNRELNNKLQFLVHHCNRVSTENQWLRSEQTQLRQKLHNLTQIFSLRPFSTSAWPCNTSSIFTTD